MSNHYSGPDFGFPHGDARLDFTDLYAFPKPGDTGKSILIMNVHPSVGVNPPGPTTDEPFASEAVYELKIDTNGDRVADIAYRVRCVSPWKGTFHEASFFLPHAGVGRPPAFLRRARARRCADASPAARTALVVANVRAAL